MKYLTSTEYILFLNFCLNLLFTLSPALMIIQKSIGPINSCTLHQKIKIKNAPRRPQKKSPGAPRPRDQQNDGRNGSGECSCRERWPRVASYPAAGVACELCRLGVPESLTGVRPTAASSVGRRAASRCHHAAAAGSAGADPVSGFFCFAFTEWPCYGWL